MTDEMEEQVSFADLGIWCGKTSQEHSAATAERTSEPSSKRPQKLQTPKFLYLDLRRGNGLMQGALWEEGTASLGEPSMLNFSECPSVVVESHLSQILEVNPHPKYSLSARACQGILNRAERRGKELPPMLKTALIRQSLSKNELDALGGVKEYSFSTTENITSTLRAQEHGQQPIVYDARENGNGELAPTITGDHQNRVTDYTALCIGNGQMCNMSMKPIANSLDTMHDQQAVMTWGLDRAAYNQGKNAKYNFSVEQERIGAQVAKGPGAIATQSIVRRLTPMECERLQGYPDGWTDIGEWTDSKGKKHKAADSPRYKALGNSIAIPCWRFILKAISDRCKERTMASLFDGIGGFPLIWEEINGSKSCRWVSEIEEFPIAVTKIRFEQE